MVLIKLSLVVHACQVTYAGNTTFKNGFDFGESPSGTLTLAIDEQIITVFGRAGGNLDSIGFITDKGNTYGPWGGPGGYPYSQEGTVVGFHGGLDDAPLTSIGTWVVPFPPTVSSASPPPPPVIGRIQSPAFGSQSNLSVAWDDGASSTGRCPSPFNLS
jgi:hypothetical protein